jgi:acyl-coenzyme A synthetase/AMP-(fatty) acid ligase
VAAHNMPDYETTRAEFRWETPEYFNFARDVLDRWSENSRKLALWWVDDQGNEVKKTFAQLCQESRRVCNMLAQQGVRRGDVVIVILPRLIEWWVVKIACLRMGAVISPGTIQLTAKDIRYRLQASEAVAIIVSAEVAPEVDKISDGFPKLKSRIIVSATGEGWASYSELLESATDDFEAANTRADENAILYFTSGTTGYPKMTVHTHSSYPIGHRVTGAFWLDLREDDLHWNLSDTGWAKAAWSSFYGPWNMGATVFVHHSAGFDSGKTLQFLSRYPITTLCAAPTVYRLLVLEDLQDYRFRFLRRCVAAGEPLNPEVIEVWKKATGIVIQDGYGQTETVLVAGNFPGIEPRFGSMGKPSPGFDLSIIDDQGNILPPHQEGDIAIRVKPSRPAGLFKEYWKDPARTASVYRKDWYVTGDRAYRDEDDYFWFVGRADDVILSAGYRIGPFEVESALLEHEAVAESAVVSSPDEVRGEVVKAFIVLKPDCKPSPELVQELQELVKRITAPYKYPRKIEFVESLPKTVSGKIRRVELRQKEWGQSRER